ncbi:MAG TPA: HEAT repeat domain-containing protein, partial [Candidatus Binataceae bacterium]
MPAAADQQLAPHLPELLALDNAAFSRRFSKSAVKRARRRGLLRNVAVVLGNTRNRDATAALARALEAEPEPLVRSHAAWALGEIGGAAARRMLERARARDNDREVKREASAALNSISA